MQKIEKNAGNEKTLFKDGLCKKVNKWRLEDDSMLQIALAVKLRGIALYLMLRNLHICLCTLHSLAETFRTLKNLAELWSHSAHATYARVVIQSKVLPGSVRCRLNHTVQRVLVYHCDDRYIYIGSFTPNLKKLTLLLWVYNRLL